VNPRKPLIAGRFCKAVFILSLQYQSQRKHADNQSSDGQQNAEQFNIRHPITSASVRRRGGTTRRPCLPTCIIISQVISHCNNVGNSPKILDISPVLRYNDKTIAKKTMMGRISLRIASESRRLVKAGAYEHGSLLPESRG